MSRRNLTLSPPRPAVEAVRRALLRGLDPVPQKHEDCPRCGGALAEPDDPQLLTVADLSREELHEASGALMGGMGPPPPQPRARARLMWCPACARLVPAGAYPAAWMRIIHEGKTRPEDAPHGLLRNYRDKALVQVVQLCTGHTEVEERWLRERGHRSWLNYHDGDGSGSGYRHVTDYWVFFHDDALLGPVLELAMSYGWWPEWGGPRPGDDAGAGAGPGPAAAEGVYDGLLVDDDVPPMFGSDS
jgi:hypothetical protein